MEAKATARMVRVSARKARLVVDLIRGKDVQTASNLLRYLNRGSARPVSKVLESAVANAINNYNMLEEELYVKTGYVDEGPTLKRALPRARGRADTMKKRTSHITVVVGERNGQ